MAPPLAEGFVTRPETAPSPAAALIPGAVVALVSGRPATEGSPQREEPCGTTQLAVYMAESLWWSREVDLLVWVAGGSRASVLAGYTDAAAAGINPDGTAEEVAARFAGWLGQTARPWLVVIDGLRDAADLDGLWPSGPAGRVVITAADEKVVAGQPGVQVMTVGAFSPREAMTYLMGRLSTDPDQRHGAMGLAAELDCQPLALAQASATIATSIVSCQDYQDRLTRRRARLTGPGVERPPAGGGTWRLSAEQAERLSPGGAVSMLLALAAFLGGDAIPVTVFTSPAACAYLAGGGAPADAGRAWDAVLALERTGLLAIGADSEPAVVWMSPVVAAQVQAATAEEVAGQAVTAATAALVEAWPEDPQPWLAAGLRSCAASVHRAGGERLWAAGAPHPLLLRAGHSLDSARLTGPAVSYWRELATTSERLLGPGNPATLAVGSHLVRALLAAGQGAAAVEWSQWVLAGQNRTLGPDHPDTLAARVSLGRALAAAGQSGRAVSVLAQAAAECGRVHGPGHLDTLSACDDLAAACLAAGNSAGAIDHYRRTLADRERIQGPDHPGTITARDKLAAACLADGRFDQAISCRGQALADRERLLGADHLDTLAARADLASAYHAAGHIAAALHLFEQVCGEYERVLGADHPQTLARQADLARAYRAAGRLTDAAALFRDILARCERALPPGDPLTQALREATTGATP
jgi:tetratricopeptide (TPR) repeat protein